MLADPVACGKSGGVKGFQREYLAVGIVFPKPSADAHYSSACAHTCHDPVRFKSHRRQLTGYFLTCVEIMGFGVVLIGELTGEKYSAALRKLFRHGDRA